MIRIIDLKEGMRFKCYMLSETYKHTCFFSNEKVVVFNRKGEHANLPDYTKTLQFLDRLGIEVDISKFDENETYDWWRVDDLGSPDNLDIELFSVKNNKLNQKLYKDIKTGEDDEYIYY